MREYIPREKFYRKLIEEKGLVKFEVKVEETDMLILAEKNLKKEIEEEVKYQRNILKSYIKSHPEFLHSFSPVEVESEEKIIKLMSESSKLTSTGPMASVAGAMAEIVGKKFLKYSRSIFIENGGDIFAKFDKDFTIGIYAGKSPFSMKIGIKMKKSEFPYGIGTSSGKIGHSFSYGDADAVSVISKSSAFSDGAATYFGNIVKGKIDEKKIEEELKKFPFIEGILIIREEKLFIWGNIELVYI